jgi:hypothetical protein
MPLPYPTETYAKAENFTRRAFYQSIFFAILKVPINLYSVWYINLIRHSKGLKLINFRDFNWYTFNPGDRSIESSSSSP